MRFRTLLFAAGLAAGSLPALADSPTPAKPHVEHHEWSMSTEHGRLGISVIGLTPELREFFGTTRDRGMLVGSVEPGSAAAKAGIAVGDVVVTVSGRAVASARELLDALAEVKKGQTAAIEVVRDHKLVALRPTLTEDPPPRFAVPEGAWPDDGWFEQMFDHFRHARPPRDATGRPSDKT